jgi:hypothetical protein
VLTQVIPIRFADFGLFHTRLVSELPSEHKKIPRTEVLGIT